MKSSKGIFVNGLAILIAGGLAMNAAIAGMRESDSNTTITFVAINGDIDAPNSGTSCIKVSDPTVASYCTNGFVAIPKNNKSLLSAALQAKASAATIWLNYSDSFGSQHCPGQSYTNCTVSSIAIK